LKTLAFSFENQKKSYTTIGVADHFRREYRHGTVYADSLCGNTALPQSLQALPLPRLAPVKPNDK
jgi:hypothetical protein